jgi:hypothetical protein
MEDVTVPQFYITNSKLTDAELQRLQDALAIHPAQWCIYTSPYDAELARRLADDVLCVRNPLDTLVFAHRLAKDGIVSLVIGDAAFLDAVYADDQRVPINV